MNTLHRLLALPVLALTVATAHASTFANITVDGDFSEWAEVPSISLSFSNDPEGGLNIANVKMANNATHLFIYVSFTSAVSANGGPDTEGGPASGRSLIFGVDRDQNFSTGLNVFGVNRVGVEGTWVNDTGVDNLNGGSLSANAGISPYYSSTLGQEYSISLGSLLSDNSALFGAAGSSFAFAFYTSGNQPYEKLAVGSYTLSGIPEPSTYAALAGFGALTLAFFRRRR
ncbi:MAG: PEP-CTERM sorting domain-containing protein [Rariglobus sp.]|nr:PEP-CTERM sorting domain-containing protein [Rariglobus sp.]